MFKTRRSRKNVITMKAALGEKINNKAYAGEKATPKEITLKFTGEGVKAGNNKFVKLVKLC